MNGADALKLEIWRELFRSRPAFYPSGFGAGGQGGGYSIPVPDPVECAARAQAVYVALYPAKAKPAKKSGR